MTEKQKLAEAIQTIIERLEGEKRVERNPITQGGKTNDWYQNGYDVGHNAALDLAIAIVKEV